MKVLIAEDDKPSQLLLKGMTEALGFEVIVCSSGNESLRKFLEVQPEILIVDWMLPEMDGLTVVKTIRAFAESKYTYILMVTARREKSDVAISMQAGVDSFMTKPVDADRLKASLRVARRIMSLQESLAKRVTELEEAQTHVEMLQGFLPICAYCKNIRDDQQLWKRIDEYITEHQSSVTFSHSICPDCFEKHVKPMQAEFFEGKVPAQ